MKKISIFCLLAGTALLCAVPVSLQFSQDKLSVSLDGASARIGEPLSAGSIAGVHRRAERRAARGADYGGYDNAGYRYGGVGYGVERRAARRAYYGGYGNGGYGMAAAGAAGAYAGAAYNAGSNSYPARATFTQGYMPTGYYGPVCNPSTDRLCQ
jgi:hypothetical protein